MATRTIYEYKPDYAVHPGEYLEEVLEAREIKKRELAERLGISFKHLSQIINGQQGITADMAVQLERILGVSANIWNNINAAYELFRARGKESQELADQTGWIEKFPITELKKACCLPQTRDKNRILKSLLEFFGLPNPESWKRYYENMAVSFRKSSAFKENLEHVAAWLRTGEKFAEKVEAKPFSKEVFEKNLLKIRGLTRKDPMEFEPEMKRLCSESGVILTFVPEMGETHLSGATRWLTQDKALIVMSLRYNTNDHFWFTFFHEAGHIILHAKKAIFIDVKERDHTPEEKQADDFACSLLIPEAKYKEFIRKGKYFPADIQRFAETIGIHPGIVAGRLQHEGRIRHEWGNKLKERFSLKLNSKD